LRAGDPAVTAFRKSVMRTKNVVPRLRAKKRLFKRVKGSVGGRRRLLRTAKEAIIRAGVYAHRDRRRKKRDFRRLWIVRLNAACRERGLRYSQLIAGLAKIGCELDRRTLSEMAIEDPTGFDAVVAAVREGLGLPEPAAVA
jgi:large subunit ribosomal protein L20